MADYFRDTASEESRDSPVSLNAQEREALRQRMEADILQRVDINFLFNSGDRLRVGLIDQHKAFKVMLKIKEVARKQVERGLKEIDYNEIVTFLKEEEVYGEQQRDVEGQHPNAMPQKLKVRSIVADDSSHQLASTLPRNNGPKLLTSFVKTQNYSCKCCLITATTKKLLKTLPPS